MSNRSKPLLRFNKKYFLLFIALFVIEVFIAIYVHDKIIRPYIGDFLVVMLIYCFVRSFIKMPVGLCAACVLVFAYMVEVLQYVNIINFLGLQNSRLAVVVLGSSFEWLDMVAYTLGTLVIIGLEKLAVTRNRKSW